MSDPVGPDRASVVAHLRACIKMCDGLSSGGESAALYRAALRDVEAMGALEAAHTLHNSVEVLYVVDGYEVDFTTHDGATVYATASREDLADAILAASRPREDGR